MQLYVAIPVMLYELQATKVSLDALIVPLVRDGLSPGVRLLCLPDVLYTNMSEGCHQP